LTENPNEGRHKGEGKKHRGGKGGKRRRGTIITFTKKHETEEQMKRKT